MKVILAFVFCLLSTSTLCLCQEQTITNLIDQEAPPVVLKTIDNELYNLGSKQEHIFVVNFWFIGCAPCRKELPMLNHLATANINDSSIVFISVSTDTEDAIKYVRKRLDLKFKQVVKGQPIVSLFQIKGFPTNLVIDMNGKIIFYKTGFTSEIESELQMAIDRASIHDK